MTHHASAWAEHLGFRKSGFPWQIRFLVTNHQRSAQPSRNPKVVEQALYRIMNSTSIRHPHLLGRPTEISAPLDNDNTATVLDGRRKSGFAPPAVIVVPVAVVRDF